MRAMTERIRPILIQYEEGLTARHIAALLGVPGDAVKRSLRTMADVYIDRWTQHTKGGVYVPVYVKVDVPEDCPQPS
jgi:predicted DNA-binding transcriptional regulator YafY